MDTLEVTVRVGGMNVLTQEDKALIIDSLQRLIFLSREELANQNQELEDNSTVQPLGDRIQQLNQQIEAWQTLLEKLGGNKSGMV